MLAILRTHQRFVSPVAFSPDGHTLASAHDKFDGGGTVLLWSTASHKQLGKPLNGHQGGVSAVAFSPDGHMLASHRCSSAAAHGCSTISQARSSGSSAPARSSPGVTHLFYRVVK